MPQPSRETIEAYLRAVLGRPVQILDAVPLGGTGSIKGYGYGVPLLLTYEDDGPPKRAVLETMSPGPFGHEHMADRAQVQLWAHRAFNALPRHVRSLDVGAIRPDGSLLSLGEVEELFVLTEFAEGRGYFEDLSRLRDTGDLVELDLDRADALCDYLVEIHKTKGGDPGLYRRRIRELVGHGECAMGLADSYPDRHGFITPSLLEAIEHHLVSWRWWLRGRERRLRQVHGDFHPWNLLFREGTDFTVLDRSRGEWGEPADDVACLSMNYLFFSLQRSGRVEGPLLMLFRRFWDRYLERTADAEILEVCAPFFAFRGLVMASPLWYPRLDETVRRRIFAFVLSVLDAPRLELDKVEGYFDEDGLRRLDHRTSLGG